MSERPTDDSIAEQLEDTKWEYSQRDDRRFLLDPIGQIFGTFCWDGRPDRLAPRKKIEIGEDPKV